jgi:hypothetical protein
VGIPLTVGFRLSQSLWLSQSPFTNSSFSRWNSGYHEAFSRISISHNEISAITKPFHEFLFHMMESWLSQSLFTNFSFTWWNLGYHKAFSRILFHMMESQLSRILFTIFLSHDGISAITEPFHKFFFHMMESRLSRSLFMNFSLTWWNPQNAQFGGKTLFLKDYLHRIRLVKNLASWFRAPLQGKEYGPPYSNEIAEKENVFVPKITYRFVTRILIF